MVDGSTPRLMPRNKVNDVGLQPEKVRTVAPVEPLGSTVTICPGEPLLPIVDVMSDPTDSLTLPDELPLRMNSGAVVALPTSVIVASSRIRLLLIVVLSRTSLAPVLAIEKL